MNISTRRLSLAATVAVVALAVLMVVSPAAAAEPAAAAKPVGITEPAAAGKPAADAKPAVSNNAPQAALARKHAVSANKGAASAKRQLLPADTPSPQTGDFEIDSKGKLVRYKGSAKDVVIPDSVKVIGKEAFYRSGVVKVKVPATVTEIEEQGFAYCRELAAVEFEDAQTKPSKLAKVGESAFSRTGALKEIVLPRSVTHLGQEVFYDSGIEKAALPVGLTEIPEMTFMKAGRLKDVTVSDNVTKIDYRAFAITHSLRSLKVVGADGRVSTGFPSKLKVLGRWAFWRSGIRQAVLPSGLEAIEESAFTRSALEKLTLQEGLKSIGPGAFSFSNLTELTIPDSVVHADGAVGGTREIAKLHIGKGVGPDQLDGSFSRNNSLRTISVSEGNPNYAVVGKALFNKQRTKLVVVPRDLSGSSGPKTYNVPASVTTIARYAFSNSAYEEVNLPSGLRSVEDGTFYSSALKRIVLPRGLETIGDSAFAWAANLTEVDLGGATTIGSYAFQKTPALKTVNMRTDLNRLKEIGFDAFYESGLVEATLPDSVTAIRSNAFSGNEGLLKVRLGAGLSVLEGNVFYGTPQLREVTVAQGNQTFSAEGNMLYVKRSDGVHLIRSAPGDHTPERRVKDGVTAIDERAFADNAKLQKLRLPDGLKSIGNRAFENATALNEVRFPDSLEVVDGFFNTPSLHKADFGTQITSIDRAFEGRYPERIVVRGAKNGKFVYSYDESDDNLTNGAPRPKPVSAYFGEGMTEVSYSAGLFPKVLVLPGTLKEFNIDSESVDGQWKASAVFYVAAEPGSSAWKLASEKMSAFGMDPAKQLKRYTPMSVTARPAASSQGKSAVTADVRGGVAEGAHQVRVVAVGSDGTKTPLSDWVEAKAAGQGHRATVEYNAPAAGGKVRVEVRDHTELTLMADVSDGATPSPEPSASQAPTASPTATPTAGHAATPSPTASTGSAAPSSPAEPEASRTGRG